MIFFALATWGRILKTTPISTIHTIFLTSSLLLAGTSAQVIDLGLPPGNRPGPKTTKVFVNEGLKHVVTVTLTSDDDKVSGTIVSVEHGEESPPPLSFEGTVAGTSLKVRVESTGELVGLNISGLDRAGFCTWRLGKNRGVETLYVTLESRSGINEWALERRE